MATTFPTWNKHFKLKKKILTASQNSRFHKNNICFNVSVARETGADSPLASTTISFVQKSGHKITMAFWNKADKALYVVIVKRRRMLDICFNAVIFDKTTYLRHAFSIWTRKLIKQIKNDWSIFHQPDTISVKCKSFQYHV